MKSLAALLLSFGVFLLPAASFASAAELAWSQERVAALARDLVEPLQACIADLARRPAPPDQEEARAAINDDVVRLESRAKELAERLGGGAGRLETLDLFREFEALQQQVSKRSRGYPAPFDLHVYVDQIQSITIQLAQYYGEPSDPRDASER